MSKFLSYLLISIALVQISCGNLSYRTVYDPMPAALRLQQGASLEDEVDLLALPLIKNGEAQNISIGVIMPQQDTYYFNYGFSDTEKTQENGAIFQIGSATKLFVTSLMEILVEEDTLRHEDTLREILPPKTPLAPHVGDLTLYELMTHTAGFTRQPGGFTQLRYLINYTFTGENLYGYINTSFIYEFLKTCEISSPEEPRPYHYSNFGLTLLTHLIELKTGKFFPDLIREKITGPLNMHDTVFFLNDNQKARLVQGYSGDQPQFQGRNKPQKPWDMGDPMRNASGLYSTIDDLMIFMKAHLGVLGHPLEAAFSKTQASQVRTKTEEFSEGWTIEHFNDKAITLHYKHGMISGYTSYVGMNLEKKIAVIVLLGSFNWEDKVGHNLLLRLSNAE